MSALINEELQKTVQRPLRLGFIGGGLSSAVGQVHYAACRMDGCWEVCAGAFSRNPQVNQQTAAQWGVSSDRVYDQWQQLLDVETELDAVAVLLPTPQHYEVVSELLRKGIPVICEKALVNTLEQAYALDKLHQPNRHFLAVTYNYSGYPLLRELKALIAAGELGEVHQYQFEMPQEGFVRPPMIAGKAAPPQSWRLHDDFIPMVSFDLGIHLQHLATFLLDEEPEAVMAEYARYSDYPDVVDTVLMWLRYQSGLKGAMWYSKSALGYRNGMRLRLFGDQASAEWIQAEPEQIRLSYKDGTIKILDRAADAPIARELRYNRMKPGHPAGFIEAFANLYADIAEQLRAHQEGRSEASPYVYGLSQALADTRMMQAASLSNQHYCWQKLESI